MTSRPWLLPALCSGAVVLGFAAFAFAWKRDATIPPLESLPADMVRTPAGVTDGWHAAMPDGRVQQLPPAHTIPYGADMPRFGPSLEEAARAGRELVNPFAKKPDVVVSGEPDEARLLRIKALLAEDAAVLARGEAVWARACVVCHGPTGLGDAPITKRGFPPPPLLTRPESRALSDGEVFHAITHGRKNMPSAALQVDVADRWRVIRYLRTLQEAK